MENLKKKICGDFRINVLLMSLKEKKLCYLRIPNFVINIYRNTDQNLRHMVTGTIPIK